MSVQWDDMTEFAPSVLGEKGVVWLFGLGGRRKAPAYFFGHERAQGHLPPPIIFNMAACINACMFACLV